MRKPVRLLALLLAGGLGCSSSHGQGIAGAGGATGTGGSGATGTGGSGGGTDGGGAAGAGGARPDAGPACDMSAPASGPGDLYIQEDQLGFGAVDGKILPRQGSTSITCYTGTGYADSDTGLGKTMSWSVSAAAAGSVSLVWRYAFGGLATNLRDAKLLVNGVVVADTVTFPYTNDWNNWQKTDPLVVPLEAGASFIQLVALTANGLGNIDYLEILGDGVTPATASFSLTVAANDAAGGTVAYAPMQAFYPAGTSVTLMAVANAGYFFQSWTGDETSADANHTFSIARNTTVTARFLPTDTMQDRTLVGYAAVQDDAGTPFLVNGGSLGPSVTATTLDELKMYLGSADPYVVSFSGLIQGADAISVASNKTLLGVGATAHLMGIELTINGSRNVIIRNVAVSHVVASGSGVANDAIEITGGAQNVWIDHCELFSELVADKDYYDGLLDIKNESRFITISWTVFHDHWKVSLISSGDEQVGDKVIRTTYHHNYFHDVGSRLPSIRFGKAHVFNNYYLNNTTGSCVNSRMGAVVKVDGNFFEMSKDPIGFADSAMTGYWDVANNTFLRCTGGQPTISTGSLTLPYSYTLDPVADLPTTVPAGAGVGKL